MTLQESSDPDRPAPPSDAALAAFCEYLRLLELGQVVDWSAFCGSHPELSPELCRLLEEYERVTAILERLSPEASFSERLRARYGDSVDPGISLSGDLGGPRAPSDAGDGSGPASGVLERLSSTSGEGRRYEPRREIARGGMGAILEVWDAELRRTLAMKMVLPAAQPAASESSEGQAERRLSRFLEEAQITGQLDHPGIVPVHDIGIDEQGNVFFTMQLVDGLDLRKVFELARLERDGWNQRRVVGVLIRVCEAMAYAHSKGVIHRDLKPANIMVGRFGEAFVMDWGLAKVVGQASAGPVPDGEAPETPHGVQTLRSDDESDGASALKTLDGDVVGTPAYMAPEQARGQLDRIGPRSDVYSIGAMLYHLLSGHMPYEPLGERAAAHAILKAVRSGPPWPIQQLNPEVDEELAAICSKAMARRPEQRYEEVMALGEELRAWLEGRGVQAYTGGLLYETRKWMERNRGTTVALLALIFLAMISVLLFIWQQQLNVSRLRDQRERAVQANLDKDDAEKILKQTVAELRQNQQQLLEEAGRAQRATQQAKDDERRAREATQRANEAAENARKSELAATGSAYRSHINAAAYSLRLNAVSEARAHLEDCPPSRRGWEWQHLKLATDASLGAPIVQEGGVLGLARSASGEVLLSYGLGVPVRAWETATSRALGELEVLSGPAPIGFGPARLESHADLHPSGELVVVSSPSGFAQLFNVTTGTALMSYKPRDGASEAIAAVSISPDQELVITAAAGGVVRVYRLLGGQELSSFRTRAADGEGAGLVDELVSLAVDPSSEFVVVGDASGGVGVWSLSTGELLTTLDGAHEDSVDELCVSADSRLIATASRDGSAAVWERETGEPISRMHGHRGGVAAVAFVGDGERLVTGGEDATLRTWRVRTGKQLRVLHGHDQAVRAIVPLVEAGKLASASLDGSIRMWDLGWDPAEDRFPMSAPERLSNQIHSVCLSPTGRELVWGSPTDRRVIDLLDGHEHALFATRPPDEEPQLMLVAMEQSPDGEVLALSLGDRSLELRAVVDGRLLRRSALEGWAARELSFSADSRFLAVGGRSKQAVVVDLAGELPDLVIQLATQRTGSGRALALSPDGGRLATVDSEGDLRLWDARSGALLESARGIHSSTVASLAFSPDGEVLASAGRDHLVRLWNGSTLEQVAELEGHRSGVTHLAFSPVERRLASAGSDGQVWIWDLDAGEALLELEGISEMPLSLEFTHAGDALVAAESREVVIWHTRDGGSRYRGRSEALQAQAQASALHARLLRETCSPVAAEAEVLSDGALSTLVQERTLRLLADARSSFSTAEEYIRPRLFEEQAPLEALRAASAWLNRPELRDESSPRWQGLMGALSARLGDGVASLAHFALERELAELETADWLFVALAHLESGETELAADALARAAVLPAEDSELLAGLRSEVASKLDEFSDG
jgi:WD40 repeat protein/serine/threonine protein kinase